MVTAKKPLYPQVTSPNSENTPHIYPQLHTENQQSSPMQATTIQQKITAAEQKLHPKTAQEKRNLVQKVIRDEVARSEKQRDNVPIAKAITCIGLAKYISS